MGRQDLPGGLIFLLFFSAALYLSVCLGIGSLSSPQSGFMPFWVSLLALVFCVILLLMSWGAKQITDANIWREVRWPKILAVAVCLAFYVFVLPRAGYVIATFFLMTVLFGLTSMKIRTAVWAAFLSVGMTYGLFYFLLKTPLPRGFWGF